jgi:hypothetical protein
MEGESKQSSSSPVRRGFTNNIYQQYLPGISYLASEQPVKAALAIQHNRGEARI